MQKNSNLVVIVLAAAVCGFLIRCFGGEAALYGRIPSDDMPKCIAVVESITPFFQVSTNEWRSGFRHEPPFAHLLCSSVPLRTEWGFWKITPWPFENKLFWIGRLPVVGTIGFIPLKEVESLQKQKYAWCTTANIMTNQTEILVLSYFQTNVYSRIILGTTCHKLSRHLTTSDLQVPYSAFHLLPELWEAQASVCEQLATRPADCRGKVLSAILLDDSQHEEVRSAAAILAVESSDGLEVLPILRKLANDKGIGSLLRCTLFAAIATSENAEDVDFIRQWTATAPLFYGDTAR